MTGSEYLRLSFSGTLPGIIDAWAKKTPDSDAILSRAGGLSYQQLSDRSFDAAKSLWGAGVRPGDRVCVLTSPSIAFAVSVFAVLRIGAIWVGINPKYKENEVRHILEDCSPKLILVHESVAQVDAADACRKFAATAVKQIGERIGLQGQGGASNSSSN